jgi:chromosome segregation ATPase
LEAAEASASEARIARAHLERDLRELGESGDGDGDPETALARHKSEMAGLRRDLEESEQREREATARIAELEQGLAEAGEDAQKQQAIGEIERLRAAVGQATTLAQEEAKRRSELEDELESRVVAEERLRAMLQAKGAPPRSSDDADSPPVGIEALEVGGAVATTQGDFLDRLAAANKQAEAVER